MKFAVIVPIRPLTGISERSSDSILKLANITVDSLANTNQTELCIFVVGSGDLIKVAKDCEFLQILDLPLQQNENASDNLASEFDRKYADMHAKRRFGAIHAFKKGYDAFLFLDADDLVHKGIFSFAAEHPDSGPWVSRSGWEYLHRFDRCFFRDHKFAERSGSCLMIDRKSLESDFKILDPIGNPGVFYHHEMLRRCLKVGSDFPFPAFVYRTEHGNNFTFGISSFWRSGVIGSINYLIRLIYKLLRSTSSRDELESEYGNFRNASKQYMSRVNG